MLSTVFSEEKTRSIIDVMPDEMIVWKVVSNGNHSSNTKYNYPDLWLSAWVHGGLVPYLKGRPPISSRPSEGYHSFVTQKGVSGYVASRWHQRSDWIIVTAKISKKDITALGTEDGSLCVVSKYISMPTYPNTDITKELRQAPLIEECREVMELMNPVSDGSQPQEAVSCGMDVGR